MEQFSLKNKRIVVTGASSGIGRACAVECNRAGANVLIIARNAEALENTKALMPFPGNCMVLPLDLTNFEHVSETIKTTIASFGAIHGVIHAAGISTTLPFRSITPAKMNEFFQVNVISALHLTQQLLKPAHVNGSGASIVFLSSVMSEVGESAKVLYSMTKGALLAAARSLALEMAPKNIRVNCVAPGLVDTPMTQKAYYSQSEEMKEKIVRLHPLGLGKPEDVANACIYLLSDASRWITGTQLMVDGGYTAR